MMDPEVQSILEPPDVELDNFPEIASFHESQDSYMREINQSNIYSKFDINITTPHIDNPDCYQSNWPTQESYMSLPFPNPSSLNQFIPIPTSSYSPNNSPLYSNTHLACDLDSTYSKDSIHSHFRTSSRVSQASALEVGSQQNLFVLFVVKILLSLTNVLDVSFLFTPYVDFQSQDQRVMGLLFGV